MLIIEGPDLVGKTTLARQILERPWFKDMGYIYRHFSRLPDTFDNLRGYNACAYPQSVQDRFHMSAPVYSAVREEAQSTLCPEQYRIVDAQMRLKGAFTIIITGTPELIQSRWREGEMYPIEKVLSANQHYKDIITDHRDGELWRGYQMDFDDYYSLSLQTPTIDPDWIDDVVDRYIGRRQYCLST